MIPRYFYMIGLFIIVFLLALLGAFFLTPKIVLLARSVGALDHPDERKVHDSPLPTLGGLAIYGGVFLAMVAGVVGMSFFSPHFNMQAMLGVLFGGSFIVLIGIIDDIKGLPAVFKLAGQILGAYIAFYFGVRITFVSSPFGGIFPIGAFAMPITLFWLVGVTNAVNFIDGLDGLATGVVAIAALTLFVVALRLHQMEAAIVAIALLGGALGFLRYNFSPASIFLGDTGSLFLGFLLASVAVMGVLKSTLVIALIVPILILGVPLFDTAAVIVRRVRAGQHIFRADQRHLHHRLLQAGFTQKEAVMAVYLACIILSGGALVVTVINSSWAYIFLSLILVAASVVMARIKTNIRRAAKEDF